MDFTRRTSLAGMLAAAAAPALAKAAKPATSRWAAAEAVANRIVADKLAPGLQVSVRRHGAMVFSKGFGLADIETATPMTPASVCRIGSITKQFTASVILQLAQEGKLSLNDNLAVYLPEFPNAQRLGLRRMLSHTSGLGNYTAVEFNQFLQASRVDRNTTQLVEAMKPTSETLAYEPGTDWRYSNTAYVLLGVIIERVSGKAYAQVMRERLFAPLGLTHTAVDDAGEVVPNRANGYSNARPDVGGFRNASFIAMSFPGGAGNMRATTEDLCAWHAALLGGKVLPAEALKEMLTPVRLANGELPTALRRGAREPVHYGYGIGLEPRDGRPCVSHDGGIQGFASHLETLTDDQVTIASVINTDGGAFAPKALATAPGELHDAFRKAALA